MQVGQGRPSAPIVESTEPSKDGALGDSHIAITGHWELTQTGPDGKRTTSQVRATEIIVKTPAGWRYVSDHASIGVPSPKPAKK